MKNTLLLPGKCRTVGFVLLPVAIALLIAYYKFDVSIPFLAYHTGKDGSVDYLFSSKADILFSKDFAANYTGTAGIVLTFVSLFMIAFSRLRHEDEYVSYMRLRALQLSVYVNYLILFLTALTIFGFTFIMVMEINLFTILILFILIFNYNIHIKPKIS